MKKEITIPEEIKKVWRMRNYCMVLAKAAEQKMRMVVYAHPEFPPTESVCGFDCSVEKAYNSYLLTDQEKGELSSEINLIINQIIKKIVDTDCFPPIKLP